MPSPIKANVLEQLLGNYHDKKYLIDGLTYGLRISYSGDRTVSTICNNSASARENPHAVDEKLALEIKKGRLGGPFLFPPFSVFKTSPIAIREKSNGKFRLLHNLSYPYDMSSINYNISEDNASVKYKKLDDAIHIVNQLSQVNNPPFMCKSDIENAFRLLPIHPDDYKLLGFTWRGKYYYDKCLPMGCSSSCAIFERFSDGLVYILKEIFNVRYCVKVLDDFLFISNSKVLCQQYLDFFSKLCNMTRIPIAYEKTTRPDTIIIFLGIELDSVGMTARLPDDKLVKYQGIVQVMLEAESLSLKELQSAIGNLMYATCIIAPGRAFLRRLYSLVCGHTNPRTKIPINAEAKKDLSIWAQFLVILNSKQIISVSQWVNANDINMYTNASKLGYGGTYGKSWIQGHWPQLWQLFSIFLLELYPIYILIKMFSYKIRNSRITINCDNTSVVQILNKQSSKDKAIMDILRPMILCLINNNITLHAVHIPGKNNILADFLSRQEVIPSETGCQEEERRLAEVDSNLALQSKLMRGMAKNRSVVPDELLPQNFVFSMT